MILEPFLSLIAFFVLLVPFSLRSFEADPWERLRLSWGLLVVCLSEAVWVGPVLFNEDVGNICEATKVVVFFSCPS